MEIETAMDEQLSSIVTEPSYWAASLRGGCARQCVFFASVLGLSKIEAIGFVWRLVGSLLPFNCQCFEVLPITVIRHEAGGPFAIFRLREAIPLPGFLCV